MKKKFLLILSIIVLTILVCACGGKNKTIQQTIPGFIPSGSASGSSYFIGSGFFNGSSSSAYDFSGPGISFTITNATGFCIQSMIIKNMETEEEQALISSEKPFDNWESRSIFYPLNKTDNLSEGPEGNTLDEYSVEVELENGVKYLLHDFPIGTSVKMLAVYEENVGYLIYENLKNNKMISTLENESILSKQNTVYAGETYGEIQDPYTDYYQNPYSDYDRPPVYNEPDLEVLPSQGSKDGCLDGGLFW